MKNAVEQFHELLKPYPHAAAGLIQDLCSKLRNTVDYDSDSPSIESQIAMLRECFREMDAGWPPDCYAWDEATHELSKWLNGPRPRLHRAVHEITGWPDEKIVELKDQFPRMTRMLRDEYNLVLEHFPEWNSES